MSSSEEFAALTHAAGISLTGDAGLDQRLPFDEPYSLSVGVVESIERARARGGRVMALGTTVTRALEHAAANGSLRAGEGVATLRIGAETSLRVVDGIVTGTHEPTESHYDILRAFTDEASLRRMGVELEKSGYRTHEFGDSVMVVKRRDLYPRIPG
jgi:S-adenosylmethionine:tRNA ribosyltransferase-isomerase